ncbi:sulfotransferase family 2 domain-containing protein [Pseudooceanicola onchidii]|uniref:sulfotransferase family 2 domain-containing protein n=1 Tax=Pseudooceanicola onchidii TaxID=2562279 RepID=UPI0010A9CF31|nr:sulfotransferase family 2 domain-containing protein [Pseudooceanicola onchidii]
MMVFGKAKLVFLSVPKTGTTAWEKALGPSADILVNDPPDLKHAPVFRYNRFFRPMLEKFVGEDLEIIAVIREPVSWLGSWYRYRRRPFMEGRPNNTYDVSFDDFVEGYCRGEQPGYANVGSQAKFVEPAGNGTAVTRLFRYEDQASLHMFLEDRLNREITLTRENVSPEMTLSLSPEMEAKLRRKCAAEFALYNSLQPTSTP